MAELAPTNRYHRQMLLPQVGQAGQERLARARVLLVGCGALGCVIADHLARAGVGFLRLVDRDLVEPTNLQRQSLYDEADAAAQLPKAVAAAQRLSRINSSVTLDPRVLDLHAGNVEDLSDVDLILDGTDNVQTRYLLNDVAVKGGVGWVYGGVIGVEGRVLVVRPRRSACLRCLYPIPPQPGDLPTCDTAGVLGPAVGVVASLQSLAALQLLLGHEDATLRDLLVLDLWHWRFHAIDLTDARQSDCIACARNDFQFLAARTADAQVTLCGRNAVQILPDPARFNLSIVTGRLSAIAQVQQSRYFTKCQLPDGLALTIFPDGRTLVHGTVDPNRARSIFARYIGS